MASLRDRLPAGKAGRPKKSRRLEGGSNFGTVIPPISASDAEVLPSSWADECDDDGELIIDEAGKEKATRPFLWTGPKARAAVLLAEDLLTDAQIAAQVGYHVTALYKWKRRREFLDRIDEHVAEIRAAAVERGIGNKLYRLAVLQAQIDRMLGTIKRRANHPSVEHVPGGEYGLVVASGVKVVPTAEGAPEPWFEFEVDTGLLRELREYLKQGAQEVGDWSEKREITGLPAGPARIDDADLSALDDDELEDEIERLTTRHEAARRSAATGAAAPPPGLSDRNGTGGEAG